ncbi:hypothetical protein SAMN05421788_11349 [Filimonas lacunae]|uniref:Uncharacterized protein n=2 Tax=Filimonas lacunae TaxID=477680 RepID=A0A1N7REX3_9BACT|nr:hypothetical protein SAMN05421788_11349 [Filimonas lacunae]
MQKMSRCFILLFSGAVLTFLQGYVAVHYLKAQPSSACLTCSLESDLLSYSTLALVPLTGLLLVFGYLRVQNGLFIATTLLLLMISWAVIDTMIFDDRVASWSTFTTAELWLASLVGCLLPVMAGGIAWWGIAYFTTRRYEHKVS